MRPKAFETLPLLPDMPGKTLSPRRRAVIARAADYTTCRDLASEFRCGKSTTARIAALHRETGSADPKPHPGRPTRFDERSLAHLKRLIEDNRKMSAKELAPYLSSFGFTISERHLRRIAASLGFSRRIARTKPFLTKTHQQMRLAYAIAHLSDTLQDWQRTIFTDESSVRFDRAARVWVWRLDGEAMKEDCLVPKFQKGPGSVMLWGAIWYGGRSELFTFDCSESKGKKGGVTGEIYTKQIVQGPMKDIWKRVNNNWRGFGGARILEDNAPVHTDDARAVGEGQRFIYVDHPPASPDLNPIENVWAVLKHDLARLQPRPTRKDDMVVAANKAWHAIPQAVIDNAILSMPKRLEAVRKAKGMSIDY